MATFRPTLLAVEPCLVCTATETVPGSFVSISSSQSRSQHTQTSLARKLAGILGSELAPDGSGGLLCARCLALLNSQDHTESRLRQATAAFVRMFEQQRAAQETSATAGIG